MFKLMYLFIKKLNEWYKMYKLIVYDMYLFINNLKKEKKYISLFFFFWRKDILIFLRNNKIYIF